MLSSPLYATPARCQYSVSDKEIASFIHIHMYSIPYSVIFFLADLFLNMVLRAYESKPFEMEQNSCLIYTDAQIPVGDKFDIVTLQKETGMRCDRAYTVPYAAIWKVEKNISKELSMLPKLGTFCALTGYFRAHPIFRLYTICHIG